MRLLLAMLLVSVGAFANPACPVCLVAIGGAIEVTRILGLPSTVAGVWIGALLMLAYYFMNRFMEKRGWAFRGYRVVSALLAISTVPFVRAYIPYSGAGYFGVDAFYISMVSGAAAFWASQALYAAMKAKNGNHAHFPFEKVVMALVSLTAVSACFNLI
ncbi:MAG: hypothetical protein LBT92_04065 [Rickettsiales bacterium]|jgi:uncharacterized membrane protein (UPF0136 family)|nr:hypothetical protein [Rickettsiales bacterium]